MKEILRNREILFAGTAVVITIAVFVTVYSPMIIAIKQESRRCSNIESKLAAARKVVGSGKDMGIERVLPGEDNITEAITELTFKGRSSGINFLSIAPEDVKTVTDAQYKVLPVAIKLESTYRDLGLFLGSLDEFDEALLKVKDFTVKAKDEHGSLLIADLTLEMYLSNLEEE